MSVPASLAALSTTAASNPPAGTDSVFPELDDHLRTIYSFEAQLRDQKAPLASPTFTGVVTSPQYNVDTNFNWALSGGNPVVTFDTGDSVSYDRASDIFRFRVGTYIKLSVSANGPERPDDASTADGLVRKSQMDAADAAAAASIAGINRLINPTFSVNQESFGGGVRSAGAYGHDMWKAGSGGCNYSVSGETATIASGTLLQIIEGVNVPEGGNYVLSWTGTATARVDGGAYAASPIVVTGKTAGANTTIEFSTGTVLRPQYEAGTSARAFQRRHFGMERALCERYFYRVPSILSVSGITTNGGPIDFRIRYNFPTTMRATPTIANAIWTDVGQMPNGNVIEQGPDGFTYVGTTNTVSTSSASGFFAAGITANARL